MDIKQLRYFTAIVEHNYNLSHAATMLYISQPTLSMMINDFEKKEGVKLFKRERSRITGLTYIGERYYEDALKVLTVYHDMISNLHNNHTDNEGTITIGIPPLVLSVVFSTIMPTLILENPNMTIDVKELGAYQLKDELLLGNVDLAVLLAPAGFNSQLVETYEIQHSELAAFFSDKHDLAQKKNITWQDLNNRHLALFDDSFMINHFLTAAFGRHQVHPNILLTSGSWDYMLNAARINKEVATILPKPIQDLYQIEGVTCRPIEQPVIWTVILARLKKSTYSHPESFILDSLLNAVNHK
ncbi:LysR family transcriptional regulator [Vagococcus sp. BWB3-3]|uniref:LysR family transcriptional regulator n=1 Tax=Vagococcus allomyrinae TaxID=2794353 RepID=A0A940SUF5_9ENTE|nr:LysR family transcriptional regulator [Vagococcus allomyrinae]MBP1040724.1 LysR family transcriptional regulator [Vagococcus allomyrinae]